uniref:Uncharacterized protein n=1 Tax=Desulfobacca acetoxidans TaxID=60893 RepID=A0A7C3WLD2_9BACT
MEQLWGEDPRIPWAQPISKAEKNLETQLGLYRWLGVSSFPRITNEEKVDFYNIQEKSRGYKDYIKKEFAKINECPISIFINEINYVAINHIKKDKTQYLLILLMNNWDTYYENYCKTYASYRPYRCINNRDISLDNLWWYLVKNELKVPLLNKHDTGAPLSQCWLPDQQTERILGNFLPIIDLQAFPDIYREDIEDWLRSSVKLRQGLKQLELQEWQAILASLPERYPSKRCQED